MVKCEEIYRFIDEMAPFQIQMDFDNAGLLLGSKEEPISRVLVALDVTMDVAKEAARKKCQLIVSHHPLIFHPLRAVTPEDPTGAVVLTLVKHRIAVISAHTNLDQVSGGVSDALMERLGVKKEGILEEAGELPTGSYGLGCCGELVEEMPPKEFASMVKKALKARGLRAVLGNRPVRRVAVCGGAGGDLITKAAAWGADAYVTADVKYHEFLEAYHRGVTLIDGGHFATENPMMEVLQERLQSRFRDEGVEVLLSKSHKEVYFAL